MKEELKTISPEQIELATTISDNEEAMAFRITAVYANLMQLAHSNKQTVGDKNDYYVTLKQLENALMSMPKSF